jgi:hypothetical protein
MKRFTLFSAMLLFLFFSGIKAQTSLTENFTDGVLAAGWQGNSSYALSEAGGLLTVNCSKSSVWVDFAYNISPVINISAANAAFVNIKLKGDGPYTLRVTLVANNGTSAYKVVRVPVATSNFVNYCLDFSALTFDKTQVKQIKFAVNYDAVSYGGKIYFDDLLVGTSAAKIANLSPINDVTVYQNLSGQKILITDILNAGSITVSGGAAIIKNVTTAISGSNCTITYDCVTGAAVTAPITVTAVGSGTFTNNTSVFNLTVEGNAVPTIDKPADQKIPVGKAVYVQLSGISDGNTSAEQTLTITASSNNTAAIPNPTIVYTAGSPYAKLTMNATSAGTATITVTVKDNGGAPNDTKTTTFSTTSYSGFNYAPTLNAPANQMMYLGGGTLKVKLAGISTGDGAGQTLTITAIGKNGVISSSPVTFTQGRDTAIITLTSAKLGKDTITVTITDNGNNGSNNGNQSIQNVFTVDVLSPAPEGYKVVMNTFLADTTNKLWTIEGNKVSQNATYIDTVVGGKTYRCIRIILNQKSTWTGLWYNLNKVPQEINVTNYPYMSYQILAKNITPQLMTHAYLWSYVTDTTQTRNTNGAHLERDTIKTAINTFNKVFLDFRKPGYLNDDGGNTINTHRIVRLLFNYHSNYDWPFTGINGVVYITDIRLGDSCLNVPAVTPVCTIDNVPTQTLWAVAGQQTVNLTGISNGIGSTTGITVTLGSSKPSYIPSPTMSAIGTDGKATLTYNILNTTIDSAQMIIRISYTGSIYKDLRFWVKTVSDVAANAGTINVDATTVGQTMIGFGGFAPTEGGLDRYVNDQGCTMMRLTIDANFEAPNDNPDPNVLDRSKFNKSVVDFNYIKKAAAAGVTDFFVTLWSTPSWMVQSLATNGGADQNWNSTTQKVDPIYYDEYVEYMVAIVRMIKEETGVELAGFCPQNEPAFNEPYDQLILDPLHFATVCGMLGKRLAAEGFNTKVINSEQVFSQIWSPTAVIDFYNAIRANADANQYTKVFAMHYPDATTALWNQYWNACKISPAKEFWATECTSNGNDYKAIMDQCKYMITGFSYGCSAWNVWGYDQGSIGDENDASKIQGMAYGKGVAKHYWAFKNFARYIRKGAVQIKTTSTNAAVSVAAFKNDLDSSMTVVLLNTDSKNPNAIKFTGSAPVNGWTAYRTSFNEKCVQVNPFKNGLVALPAYSITTLYMKTNNIVNHAPVIDQAKDKYVIMNGTATVNLTGISNSDPTNQTITITAVSADPSILPNPVVTYTSPNATGSLSIVPAAGKFGTVKITVTVKDNGGIANGGVDQTTMSFNIIINNSGSANHAPTINQVADKYVKINNTATVNLSGISIGSGDLNQNLTITALTANPFILSDPTVTYTSPNATGTINLVPVTGQSGTVKVTVTVKDDGGTANGGIDQTIMSFNVIINSTGTGIIDLSDKLSVFPNPADETINITIPTELAYAKITINNVSGETVSEKIVTGDNATINVSDLPGGIYMISVFNETSIAKIKFAKK